MYEDLGDRKENNAQGHRTANQVDRGRGTREHTL